MEPSNTNKNNNAVVNSSLPSTQGGSTSKSRVGRGRGGGRGRSKSGRGGGRNNSNNNKDGDDEDKPRRRTGKDGDEGRGRGGRGRYVKLYWEYCVCYFMLSIGILFEPNAQVKFICSICYCCYFLDMEI